MNNCSKLDRSMATASSNSWARARRSAVIIVVSTVTARSFGSIRAPHSRHCTASCNQPATSLARATRRKLYQPAAAPTGRDKARTSLQLRRGFPACLLSLSPLSLSLSLSPSLPLSLSAGIGAGSCDRLPGHPLSVVRRSPSLSLCLSYAKQLTNSIQAWPSLLVLRPGPRTKPQHPSDFADVICPLSQRAASEWCWLLIGKFCFCPPPCSPEPPTAQTSYLNGMEREVLFAGPRAAFYKTSCDVWFGSLEVWCPAPS